MHLAGEVHCHRRLGQLVGSKSEKRNTFPREYFLLPVNTRKVSNALSV